MNKMYKRINFRNFSITFNLFVKDAKKISGELNLDKENIKKLLGERISLKTQVENLEWVVVSQEEHTISLKKKNELINKLSSETNTLDLIGNKISKIEKEIEKLNEDVILYNRQTETIESNRYVQSSIDQLKQELSNLDYKIDAKTKSVISANGRLGVLQNQIKQLKESVDNTKELEKTYEAYSLYVKAVNRDGLPYIIISNIIPEMEREVNNILEQIVDFRLNIETHDNEINAYINYSDKKWPVELTSGFEKFISSIAIRIALVNLSNLPRPNLMIIDEGWAVIDSNNMPSVQPLLSFLKTNFDFIIVISHLDELRDCSDKNIEISKVNGFSHVEYK
jgi:DNA repair exonuclease SbcCD ATPase subunit